MALNQKLTELFVWYLRAGRLGVAPVSETSVLSHLLLVNRKPIVATNYSSTVSEAGPPHHAHYVICVSFWPGIGITWYCIHASLPQ
ncbi:unnamed protein product [Clavelina lepadiformis]|uniref:Uncharacterized protein n=1 Tax=Clavelina lepadiformis TaxID=159417 RepID=A0ABP0FS80_CLALP